MSVDVSKVADRGIIDCAPAGKMVGDPHRFPRGIKWLADQLHAMGLKLGLVKRPTICHKSRDSLFY